MIEGTVPENIYQLYNLYYLDIETNHLHGTISNSLGKLNNLQILNLRRNQFYGTIPSSIINLTNLIQLYLPYNQFNDNINDNIKYLKNLTSLVLSYNNFCGSFPSWLHELSQLTHISLTKNNFLSGTIPTNLANLLLLVGLSLGSNQLSGTIPEWFSNFIHLQDLNLQYNYLTGTIPYDLFQLSSLHVLYLDYNQLTGTIPSITNDELSLTTTTTTTTTILLSSSLSSYLTNLSLSNNQLTGTIPSISLFSLFNLQSLCLSYNLFSGNITINVDNNNNNNNNTDGIILSDIELEDNLLTGHLPISLSVLSYLTRFYVQNNLLSGELNNIFNSKKQNKLQIIQLNNNQFTGTLPSELFLTTSLIAFTASSNCFNGNISKLICLNKNLKILVLDGLVCALSCRHKIFPFISSSYISNQLITGGIPTCLWSMPNLEVLHLSGNGLDGPIYNTNVNNVDDDAFHSDYAVNINNKIYGDNDADTDHDDDDDDDAIDKLNSVNNDNEGIIFSKSLRDVILSYNLLTGTIMKEMLNHSWINLDLSHNRITGTIETTTTTIITSITNYNDDDNENNSTSLILNDNRLSGYIPSTLYNLMNINILEGNYYNCKYDRSDLPKYDSSKNVYECGSSTFNVLYYIWLSLTFMIIFIIILLLWYYHKYTQRINSGTNSSNLFHRLSQLMNKIWKWSHIIVYLASDNINNNNNNSSSSRRIDTLDIEIDASMKTKLQSMIYIQRFYATNEIIRRFSGYCTLFIIIILLPIYFILTTFYDTHTYKYAWTASLMYLSGSNAFIIAFTLLSLYIIIIILIYITVIKNNANHSIFSNHDHENLHRHNLTITTTSAESNYTKPTSNIWIICILYILINVIIVGGINITYVLIILYQNRSIRTSSQILLSIFKIVWNSKVSPSILYLLASYLSINSPSEQSFLFFMQFFCSILNNIIIPFIMIMIISPNCFYNVFKQQSDVSSSFYYFNCANYYPNGECLEYKNYKSTSSYHPPFCYSYQCSSFIIRYYAPVFVFVCFLSSFILPLSQLLIIKLRIAQQIKLFGTIFYPTQQTNNENIRLDATTASSSSSSEITTKHMRMGEIYK